MSSPLFTALALIHCSCLIILLRLSFFSLLLLFVFSSSSLLHPFIHISALQSLGRLAYINLSSCSSSLSQVLPIGWNIYQWCQVGDVLLSNCHFVISESPRPFTVRRLLLSFLVQFNSLLPYPLRGSQVSGYQLMDIVQGRSTVDRHSNLLT